MSVVVGFVIGGILVNLVIGTEGLIIAAVIALIVAGILYHVDDGIRNFVYYLIMPVMSIGIAGVAEIIWSSGQSHITFWIVYAAVILFLIIDVKRTSRKAEEGSQKALKDLCDFLKDYSHFMTGHYSSHVRLSSATRYSSITPIPYISTRFSFFATQSPRKVIVA